MGTEMTEGEAHKSKFGEVLKLYPSEEKQVKMGKNSYSVN